MSPSADALVFFMVKELSTCKYGYKETIEGCYDSAVNNYGFDIPTEPKEEIVTRVMDALKVING